jgi:hypothetical protein
VKAMVLTLLLGATPVLAEDQADLAARIMALSSSQDIDHRPPEERSAVDTAIADHTTIILGQNRMLVDRCLITVERASISEGPDFPILRVRVNLMDPGVRFEQLFPDGSDLVNFVRIRFGDRQPVTELIDLTDGAKGTTLVARIRAQVFQSERRDSYAMAVHFSYGAPDPTGELIRLIEEYRQMYCHPAG